MIAFACTSCAPARGDFRIVAAGVQAVLEVTALAVAAEPNQATVTIDDEALAELRRRPFPGNVRELRNILIRAAALCEDGCIRVRDIAGEATLEYLMAYRDDQFASFVGLERVVGRIGDRTGSFVLQQNGTFENGVVTATWSVVPDSGTGALRGLRGEGGYRWDGQHDQSATYILDYDLP